MLYSVKEGCVIILKQLIFGRNINQLALLKPKNCCEVTSYGIKSIIDL